MSTIGKVFTILNLVLAAAFLGWAANALNQTADFKSQLAAEKAAHEALRGDAGKEKTALIAEKRALETDKNTLLAQKNDAVNEAERQKAEADLQREANSKLTSSVQLISTTLGDIEAGKKKLQEDKDKAVTAQRDAETAKGAALAAQAKAEEMLGEVDRAKSDLTNQVADLEKARKALDDEKRALQTQMDTLADATGAKLADYQPVPLINGAVQAVSMEVSPGLVSINKGSNDNVRRGYTFEIYDGKTYKGQARVEFVHPTMSSALITRTVPGQTVRQGDNASTRL